MSVPGKFTQDRRQVLVVDDQEPTHRFLGPALIASDFDVLMARTGQQALQLISTAAPDVIVLDLSLPDMDGKELIAEVRHFSETPIVVLSERDRESEKIAALDLGADDYVEKPFAYGELMARLRAVLRRSRSAGKNVAPLTGSWSISPAALCAGMARACI